MVTPDKYGWYVGEDLRFHNVAESKFTHTPNWPGGYAEADRRHCQTVVLSTKLSCYGKGFSREQIEELAFRFEVICRRIFRRKDTLKVSVTT